MSANRIKILFTWFNALVLHSFMVGAIMAGCTIGWVPESAVPPTLIVGVFGGFTLIQLDAAKKKEASVPIEIGASMAVMAVVPLVGALLVKLIESLITIFRTLN